MKPDASGGFAWLCSGPIQNSPPHFTPQPQTEQSIRGRGVVEAGRSGAAYCEDLPRRLTLCMVESQEGDREAPGMDGV